MIHDAFGRKIDYLRISVTDRCNLRCIYCMPESGVELLRHQDMLSYEEILRVAAACAKLGFRAFRITGGEPLVRKGIVEFIRELNRLVPWADISMTTNGTMLKQLAASLKEAGLKRVNVSLDSLDSDTFRRITRGGDLEEVLEGIDEALRVGLGPVKTNTVLMNGVNSEEVVAFAQLTLSKPIHVRFIELMPLGEACRRWHSGAFVPVNEAFQRIAKAYPLERAEVRGSGPASYWRIPGAAGSLGFISAISSHFCGACNRVRLTAKGGLSLCLASTSEVDLKCALRNGCSDEELCRLIAEAVWQKPAGHNMTGGSEELGERRMFSIGG
ncbi:MAG: GTP 3',8-cyclase MoaA [Bacillota bacterium]